MKAFMDQYGKIIILVLIMMILLPFIFSFQNNGVMGMLQKAKPQRTTGTKDNSEILQDVAVRANPTIAIHQTKFQVGQSYNLESTTIITAKNADGSSIQPKVIKVIGPGNETITDSIVNTHFVPEEGIYEITYKALETYKNVKKQTTETFRFVAD